MKQRLVEMKGEFEDMESQAVPPKSVRGPGPSWFPLTVPENARPATPALAVRRSRRLLICVVSDILVPRVFRIKTIAGNIRRIGGLRHPNGFLILYHFTYKTAHDW